MNLFDGQFKSKPNIKLSGSSKQKDRDYLIREACNERKRRETERKQLFAAIKIQSVYRSYKVRKQIKNQLRQEFKFLLNSISSVSSSSPSSLSSIETLNNSLKNLIIYLVSFYDDKQDQDDLLKLSQLVIKHKDIILNLLLQQDQNDHQQQQQEEQQHSEITTFSVNGFEYSLVKYLSIHLKQLNKPIVSLSNSISLRTIDYFTDRKSFNSNLNNQHPLLTKELIEFKLNKLIKFLIRRGYIKDLVEFAIAKIPNKVKNETQAPLIYSIGHLLNRAFQCLNTNTSNNSNQLIAKSNEFFLNKICTELFIKIKHTQVKCLIDKLSTILIETNNNLIDSTTSTTKQIENLNKFIKLFKVYLQTNLETTTTTTTTTTSINRLNELAYEDYISILYSILKLTSPILNQLSDDLFQNDLVPIIQMLVFEILWRDFNIKTNTNNNDDYDMTDDAYEMDDDRYDIENESSLLLEEIFTILDSKVFVKKINSLFIGSSNGQISSGSSSVDNLSFLISYISYFIISKSKLKLHQSFLLKQIAFNKVYLNVLWRTICLLSTHGSSHEGNASSGSNSSSSSSSSARLQQQELFYLQILASGNTTRLNHIDLYRIVAPLNSFCSLYNLYLLPILDEEFLKGEAIFTKLELIKMSSILKDVCLGLIQLMHPDTSFSNILDTGGSSVSMPSTTSIKTVALSDTAKASSSLTSESSSSTPSKLASFLLERKISINNAKELNDLKIRKFAFEFTNLFQTCTLLVQRLHTRDIRAGFCPEDHWLSNFKLVGLSRLAEVLQQYDPSILTTAKFIQSSYLFEDTDNKESRLTLNDIRSLTILQQLPFTVQFKDRMQLLESFIYYEPQRFSLAQPAYKLRIRRDFLYEDAFDNLSLENVPNLKETRIVVEMINQLGLDEAGIDGGGVFREFMLQLLETAFDPNRGFFVFSSDGFLYPNPNVNFLVENYTKHYFFLGRILGKAIQSKILSPLKFAMFFLQKILGKNPDTRLDIDYLASLDPEVYKNLLYLKNLKSNIEDLELNFAINVNQFGETKTVELKPGGKDIYVTSDNRIEYIHLLGDYKLNKQIHNQVVAFRNGISNVINLELIRLFNFNEFQYLISGSDKSIDVVDWRMNTVYSGIYNSDHPVIRNFWNIVESMSEEQKRKLLKFVTSRSRTPLFGFKNLIPNFAVHSSGSEQRLPTSSTCLNLLKLPPIEDFNLLKEKLICAIESDAGFELS